MIKIPYIKVEFSYFRFELNYVLYTWEIILKSNCYHSFRRIIKGSNNKTYISPEIFSFTIYIHLSSPHPMFECYV